MCFTLACLMFLYLTVNSAVFYCESKPQCFSSLRRWDKRWSTTMVHSLSVLGKWHTYLPRVKETLGKCLKETIFLQVLWCVVNSNSTGRVLWTFGIAVPILVWSVLNQMDHFEGKLLLSPLYHWDKVLAKCGSN